MFVIVFCEMFSESINDLEKLAEDKFSEVIDRNVVQPSWNDTPWPDICLKVTLSFDFYYI